MIEFKFESYQLFIIYSYFIQDSTSSTGITYYTA